MIFDIAIIGQGMSGAFCNHKIAKDHGDKTVIAIDLGRPQRKRKLQTTGFLGCFPGSDAKLYANDYNKVSNIAGPKKSKKALDIFNNILSSVGDFKVSKDKGPSTSIQKRIKKLEYALELNDFTQIYPKEIHLLSRYLTNPIEANSNITFSYDNEVHNIYKKDGIFTIVTDYQEYQCKKLVMAVGRTGWRWARKIYSDLGLIESNDVARFGVRLETNLEVMSDYNHSPCTIKSNNWELGPLNWEGTVIPEDHFDVAISSFRSNEERWKTDKVSFNLIADVKCPNRGFEELDRIANLTFVLTNDRVLKEKISLFTSDKSKISVMKEYNWLKPALDEVEVLIPDIKTKSYLHVPTIIPMTPKINVNNDFSTDIEGMYVIGESSGITGLLSAALSGLVVAEEVTK